MNDCKEYDKYLYDVKLGLDKSKKKEKNGVEILVNPCEKELRADIKIKQSKKVKIWGQIKDQCGCLVAGAVVTLSKVVKNCECSEVVFIEQTVSDKHGIYCFTVCIDDCHEKYKLCAYKKGCKTEPKSVFKN